MRRIVLVAVLLCAVGCAGTKEQMDKQGIKVKGTRVMKVFEF